MSRIKYFGLQICLWIACSAHAATECAAPALDGQPVASFLDAFGVTCAEPFAIAQKKSWGVARDQSLDFGHLQALNDAWTSLARSFQIEAAKAGNSATGQFASEIQLRAKLTASDFAHDMQSGVLPPNALYRANHWSTDQWVLQAPANGVGHNALKEAPSDLKQALQQDCQDAGSSRCQSAINSAAALSKLWMTAFLAAQTISDAGLKTLNTKIQQDNEEWQHFFKSGKTMLPLDFVLTDWLEARHYKETPEYADGQVGPPKRQWFLLHPAVAMEHVNSAPDGQQLKPILQLELVGVNWWRPQDRPFSALPLLNALSGISLMTTYADRSGVKDVGGGILFVFNNSLTVGVSRYGDRTGLSLSTDLLDTLKNSHLSSDYEDLRKRFNEISRARAKLP
jgi:hypothetical protein